MNPANGDSHSANLHGQWIAAREDTTIGERHPCAFVKAERAQALSLFSDKRRPIDRCDSGGRTNRELIERHRFPLP